VKRFLFVCTLLISTAFFLPSLTHAQAESSYRFGVSGSYLWSGTFHLFMPVAPDVDMRLNLGFDYYPERDRFSPQTYTLSLGLDGLRHFSFSGLPEELGFYYGGGLNVSYNYTTFVYKAFWAFRATPLVGVTYDLGPELFLELGPEFDFSPYFNVTAIDFSPRIRLGVILFRF
jgi:hypothetical protein